MLFLVSWDRCQRCQLPPQGIQWLQKPGFPNSRHVYIVLWWLLFPYVQQTSRVQHLAYTNHPDPSSCEDRLLQPGSRWPSERDNSEGQQEYIEHVGNLVIYRLGIRVLGGKLRNKEAKWPEVGSKVWGPALWRFTLITGTKLAKYTCYQLLWQEDGVGGWRVQLTASCISNRLLSMFWTSGEHFSPLISNRKWPFMLKL